MWRFFVRWRRSRDRGPVPRKLRVANSNGRKTRSRIFPGPRWKFRGSARILFRKYFEYAGKNIFQVILIIASHLIIILCAQIHDGLDVIQLENQIHHKVGLTSGESINTVYTTSSEVEIRFKKTPASPLKLKIQKVQLFFQICDRIL